MNEDICPPTAVMTFLLRGINDMWTVTSLSIDALTSKTHQLHRSACYNSGTFHLKLNFNYFEFLFSNDAFLGTSSK